MLDYGIYVLRNNPSEIDVNLSSVTTYNYVGIGTKIGGLHTKPIYLSSGTEGTAGINSIYCYFGDFPQSLKTDDVVVDNSKFITQGAFTYYEGSDNCYYVKNDIDNKYYRVEPIKWRVFLDNKDGTSRKLLLAESILNGCRYYDNDSDRWDDENLKKVYSTDYEYSRIRAYLNSRRYLTKENSNAKETYDETFWGKGFLTTAFTSDAINLIDNANIYGRLKDKIFLMSEIDFSTKTDFYGSGISDIYRIRKPTDFAKANGVTQYGDSNEGGYWWLSTYSSYSISCVTSDGGISSGFTRSVEGVVPALYVNEINQGNINYIVSFNTNGGSTIHSQSISSFNVITCPADPVKNGFAFDGWYIDESLTQKFDFSEMITSDMILYAKWIEASLYNISIDNTIKHGTVTVDKNSASKGTVITITVSANKDYEFERISVKDSDNIDIEFEEVSKGTKYTFEMVGKDVSISASFNAIYSIENKSTDDNGTVTIDKEKATAGTLVTIQVSPKNGYECENISVQDIDSNKLKIVNVADGKKYTFIMPENNVQIVVSFKRKEAIGKIGKYGKPYFLGDIVFSDGSAVPYKKDIMLTDEQKEKAIAVIFYVGKELSNTDKVESWMADRTLGVGLTLYNDDISWCSKNAAACNFSIPSIQCSYTGTSGNYKFSGHTNGSDNLLQIQSYLVVDKKMNNDTYMVDYYPAFYFAKNYVDYDERIKGSAFSKNWFFHQ